ncbi:MAG: NAD(P)/FAD-dependent oxidoreductase [Chloroflexota bacterium]
MPHTIIIGAGAAGLAAGRMLHDAGYDILILEARDRIGGRAWTDYTIADFPIELGAEFIHGEHAATHDLVWQAGLHTIPVVRMDNLWWAEPDQPALPRTHLSPHARDIIDGLLHDYHEMPALIPPPHFVERGLGGGDISLAEYLRERGWDADALRVADVLLAQTCCAGIESLSCYDLIREMGADHAGSEEFRIEEGYAALFDWYSQELPIQLNTPVTEIFWDADEVMVISGNEKFAAQKCIITIPVSLLSSSIAFFPSLSESKQDAIRAFRTEAAAKLIYRFQEPLWDDSLTFMAYPGVAARWWTPGYGREGAATISAYITAANARFFDEMDEQNALAVGLDELSVILGIPRAKLSQQCVAAQRISWTAEPYTRGGYAHIPPGYADARPILAQPEKNILFFAGEATAYDTNPQTVHGALESGWRAAREVMG